MKIGIICEGSSDSDIKVFRHLISKIDDKIEIEENSLGSKKDIFRDCGKATKNLLMIDKCDRVLIIWDLQPSWGTEKVCLKKDREKIFKPLNDSNVDISKVFLICIQTMLEAWLLADEKAIENILSTASHPVTISKTAKPEREKDPKSKLINLFKQHKGYKYEEAKHAIEIIKRANINKLKSCSTYKRFEDKVKL